MDNERIFKKRMLILAGSTGVCGVSTFLSNFLDILNKNDVCADIIDVYKGGVKKKVPCNNYENIGLMVNAWEGRDNMIGDYNFIIDNMYPFLSRRRSYCTAIEKYVVHRKLFEMLNENIYDYIFINENEEIATSAVLDYFAFSDFIRVAAYSHAYDLFGMEGEPTLNARACRFRNIRNSINSDERIEFITQLDPDAMKGWLKNTVNQRKIGLPLNIEDYRKYQVSDSEKENKLLFIGRVDEIAKNPELWISVAKTLQDRVQGCVIVPNDVQARRFNKIANRAGYTNYNIYHSLTFDEKMKLSAKCKCFFSSSNYETFGYTVYENLALMPVVCSNRLWAHLVKRELPCIVIGEGAVEQMASLVMSEMNNYSGEKVTRNYNIVKEYRDSVVQKWSDWLNEPYEPKYYVKRKEPRDYSLKNVVLLDKLHDVSLISKHYGRECLSVEEIETLYKNMDLSKIIQTRYKSYYGDIDKCFGKKKEITSLDSFF